MRLPSKTLLAGQGDEVSGQSESLPIGGDRLLTSAATGGEVSGQGDSSPTTRLGWSLAPPGKTEVSGQSESLPIGRDRLLTSAATGGEVSGQGDSSPTTRLGWSLAPPGKTEVNGQSESSPNGGDRLLTSAATGGEVGEASGETPLPLGAGEAPTRLTAREIAALDEQFGELPSVDVLTWAWQRFGARAAIGTSFQGAGLVMMHLAKRAGLAFPVFTLDTGVLFPQTVELKGRLEDFFGVKIESLTPDLTVEQQAEAQGPELWNRDPDLCCTIRKVLPLRGKLQELDCWITGLRRQQSASRAKVGVVELYTLNEQTGQDIVKLNPMAHWSRQAIWHYIGEHKIPYNPLHDRGYRSIGCMTCTVQSGQGENERAGRWTGFNKVECGIHTFMSKKIDFQI